MKDRQPKINFKKCSSYVCMYIVVCMMTFENILLQFLSCQYFFGIETKRTFILLLISLNGIFNGKDTFI